MYDLIVKNAKILTMNEKMSQARWLAVQGGIIKAIGVRDDAPSEAEKIIDLQGKTLMPGLGDSHVHMALTGINYFATSLEGTKSIKEILNIIQEVCAKDASDDLLLFTMMPSESMLKENRFPNKNELDRVTGKHPILITNWSLHGGVINSKAIPLADLEPNMQTAINTGICDNDFVTLHVMRNVYACLGKDSLAGFYKDVSAQAVSKGLTTIHALDGMFVRDDLDVQVLLEIIDQLPLNVVPYTQTFDLDKVMSWGLPRIGGCLMLDGSGGVFTSCYSKVYPGNPNTRGLLSYSDEYIYKFVSRCTRENIQCAFHAIGDRAIDQIIYIYYQVHKEQGGINHLRHRIEHFSFPTEEHMAMAAEMDISCNDQPNFGGLYDTPDLNLFAEWVYGDDVNNHENLGRVMRAGVHVSAGTDSPCTPLDPWMSINFCVNQYNKHRHVSLDDALRLHTINVHWAANQEKQKGSLEVGKDADMIIIEQNPYEMIKDLDKIIVNKTFVKGKLVYSK